MNVPLVSFLKIHLSLFNCQLLLKKISISTHTLYIHLQVKTSSLFNLLSLLFLHCHLEEVMERKSDHRRKNLVNTGWIPPTNVFKQISTRDFTNFLRNMPRTEYQKMLANISMTQFEISCMRIHAHALKISWCYYINLFWNVCALIYGVQNIPHRKNREYLSSLPFHTAKITQHPARYMNKAGNNFKFSVIFP